MKKMIFSLFAVLTLLAGAASLSGPVFAQDKEQDAEAAAELAREAAEDFKAAAEKAEAAAEDLEALSVQAESMAKPLEALADEGHINPLVYLAAIFVLAIAVGYYVVWSVTPALHTPLMSVTNAISSVVIVGALVAVGADLAGSSNGGWARFLGIAGVAFASVNIFGGFMVTERMLAMYKKKERPAAAKN